MLLVNTDMFVFIFQVIALNLNYDLPENWHKKVDGLMKILEGFDLPAQLKGKETYKLDYACLVGRPIIDVLEPISMYQIYWASIRDSSRGEAVTAPENLVTSFFLSNIF